MAVASKIRTFETLEFRVEVRAQHIEEGKCRAPHLCMEKLAIAEASTNLLGKGAVARLRLDGAQIKFNYGGYRWFATTPKKAKTSLIAFDAKKPVGPHTYTVVAFKGTRIVRVSAERQDQINRARLARIKAGTPDRGRATFTLHQRVIGLGAV